MFISTKKIKPILSALIIGTIFSTGSICFANNSSESNSFEDKIMANAVDTNLVSNSSLAPITVAQNTSGYTGLIVDCRGLGLKPAMSPVIRVDGNEPIYGNKNLDYDKIIQKGMASYFTLSNDTSIMPSTGRAGSHPLIVKAVRLENFNTYPVISSTDAQIVTKANNSDKFFEKLAVVFVE